MLVTSSVEALVLYLLMIISMVEVHPEGGALHDILFVLHVVFRGLSTGFPGHLGMATQGTAEQQVCDQKTTTNSIK